MNFEPVIQPYIWNNTLLQIRKNPRVLQLANLVSPSGAVFSKLIPVWQLGILTNDMVYYV